eukprot:COSAG01_NODE_24935_length_761_cov_1.019637_1_plen_193_part_10
MRTDILNDATEQVLFGSVAPAGRMPVSVPRSLGQLAPYLDMHMDMAPGRTHRYYNSAAAGEQLWGFGWGCTTTEFVYSDLQITQNATAVIASAMLTNVGTRRSDEVSQLYTCLASHRQTAASPPLQELKGFQRVAALAPTRSVRLQFVVPFKSLRLMYSAGTYRVLPGNYQLWLGGRAPTAAERASGASGGPH